MRRSSPSLRVTFLLFLAPPAAFLPPLSGQGTVTASPVGLIELRVGVALEEYPLAGTVTARQRAALSPRTSGLVEAVHADAGDLVEPGAELLTLDSTLAKLAVERADAALAEARAALAESERLRDEARGLLKNATIAPTEARTREAGLAIAAATTLRLDAARREAAEILARHTVVAPFAGVIMRKLTDPGEWVATGTPVFELVALDRPRIDVQIPQERLADIADDTPVDISPDARPDVTFPGRVLARVPVSNSGTRAALIRLEAADPADRLLPGESARVTFHLRSSGPILTVPRDALVRRADGTVNVWVAVPAATGDGLIAAPRRVDLGRTFGNLLEVRAGLKSGERVIIRGNETLRDGQPVRPAAATPSS